MNWQKKEIGPELVNAIKKNMDVTLLLLQSW